MTKTVEEVRRAAFDLGMREILLGEGYCLLTVPQVMAKGSDGRYSSVRVLGAWEGFNLALDAVEIQLPKTCAYESLDSARVFVQLTYEIGSSAADPVELVRLDDCRAAIEQTGLGLRVK